MQYCPQCGKKVASDKERCPYCERKLPQINKDSKDDQTGDLDEYTVIDSIIDSIKQSRPKKIFLLIIGLLLVLMLMNMVAGFINAGRLDSEIQEDLFQTPQVELDYSSIRVNPFFRETVFNQLTLESQFLRLEGEQLQVRGIRDLLEVKETIREPERFYFMLGMEEGSFDLGETAFSQGDFSVLEFSFDWNMSQEFVDYWRKSGFDLGFEENTFAGLEKVVYQDLLAFFISWWQEESFLGFRIKDLNLAREPVVEISGVKVLDIFNKYENNDVFFRIQEQQLALVDVSLGGADEEITINFSLDLEPLFAGDIAADSAGEIPVNNYEMLIINPRSHVEEEISSLLAGTEEEMVMEGESLRIKREDFNIEELFELNSMQYIYAE